MVDTIRAGLGVCVPPWGLPRRTFRARHAGVSAVTAARSGAAVGRSPLYAVEECAPAGHRPVRPRGRPPYRRPRGRPPYRASPFDSLPQAMATANQSCIQTGAFAPLGCIGV